MELKPWVIALDGPAGVGKGTVRSILAQLLGFFELDSGALYRAVALGCHNLGINPAEHHRVAAAAGQILPKFSVKSCRFLLQEVDVTTEIGCPENSQRVAAVAAIPGVREVVNRFVLKSRQRPGLVADGRDMAARFFEDGPSVAAYFLKASPEARATRRVKQYQEQGLEVDHGQILDSIVARDTADETRLVDPLVPHPTSDIIDTTNISAMEVATIIYEDFCHRS